MTSAVVCRSNIGVSSRIAYGFTVVGQVVNLRRAVSPPSDRCAGPPRPVNNRPQDDILPHIAPIS